MTSTSQARAASCSGWPGEGDAAVGRCPVCLAEDARRVHRDPDRQFLQCLRCALIRVPRAEHLTRAAERAHYEHHRNAVDDVRYRAFLQPAADEVIRCCLPGSRGLDFGCGPAPALADMLSGAGFPTAVHDPHFFPQPEPVVSCCDFITATEVFEHLRTPRQTIARLWSWLRPGGILVVMTLRPPAVAAFGSWSYRLDPTHIAFWPAATFRWLATWLKADVRFPSSRLVVLTRDDGASAAAPEGLVPSR